MLEFSRPASASSLSLPLGLVPSASEVVALTTTLEWGNETYDVPLSIPVLNHSVPMFSEFKPADQEEVRKIISKSPNKSCSLDSLPTWLLKQNMDIMVPTITSIVNTSLSTGIFPTVMKHAVVTPLLKKPSLDKDNLKNYRPVSNTVFLSKVIEKTALTRVSDHIDNNNLHCKFQSAYKSGHSTETACVESQK